jgi:tripartite ATP-independent transporter DctM subunit
MILYAVMSGSSVVKIFVAGIIPGIMCGLAMMGLSYGFAVRRNYPVEEVFQLQKVWATFKEASWAFIVPIIILGGIFGGFVTATEGAGLAVLASLFVGGVIYREINWEHLKEATIEGGISTGVVMLLVAASALMGTILTELQIPQQLAQQITDLTTNKYAVLAMLNLFFLVVGCFLHSAAAIILVVPIVMPLVHAVGIDPVHFGLIVTLNLGIGQQTPPVASVLITACSVAKADIWEVSKVNVWYVGCIFIVLMMCTYIPAIPMFLVNLFYG